MESERKEEKERKELQSGGKVMFLISNFASSLSLLCVLERFLLMGLLVSIICCPETKDRGSRER